MAILGKCCKACSVKKLREFGEWNEKAENTRKERHVVDGKEIEKARILTDGSYLYLQENFVVTDGIMQDEHVIFESDAPVDRVLPPSATPYSSVMTHEIDPPGRGFRAQPSF